MLLCFSFYTSCVFQSDYNDTKMVEPTPEDVIDRYDTIDFSEFKGFGIMVRERGIIRDQIIVFSTPNPIDSRFCGTFRYYNGFVQIPSEQYDNKVSQAITKKKLKFIVNNFYKLDLEYLKVDSDDNVFLTPMPFSFERVFMLKANDSVSLKNRPSLRFYNGDGFYTWYKRNWYISDCYFENYHVK